jgi:hypothetical protein
MANEEPRPHYFHAEAHALKGKVRFPVDAEVRPQAFVKLAGTLEELLNGEGKRNYFSQHAKNYRLEGVFSYSAAHTQVSGHKSSKDERNSVTLATSVVENLNILNVVTADRVVAQISTTHIPGQYVPEVTFLGTHFENLKIARHKVEPILNLKLAGPKPDEDRLYVAENTPLMTTIKEQYQKLPGWLKRFAGAKEKDLPPARGDDSLTKKYHWGAPQYDTILSNVAAARKVDEDDTRNSGISNGITCSLVEDLVIEPIKDDSATAVRDAKELVEGKCGHVIHIPDFGTIFLAELTVNHNSFHLTMIRVEMGCIAAGTGGMGVCVVNGKGGSGGGGGGAPKR